MRWKVHPASPPPIMAWSPVGTASLQRWSVWGWEWARVCHWVRPWASNSRRMSRRIFKVAPRHRRQYTPRMHASSIPRFARSAVRLARARPQNSVQAAAHRSAHRRPLPAPNAVARCSRAPSFAADAVRPCRSIAPNAEPRWREVQNSARIAGRPPRHEPKGNSCRPNC